MENMRKAKNGDLIKIINSCGADWIKNGEIYYVKDSFPMILYNKDKTPIQHHGRDFITGWACHVHNYEIISSEEYYYEIY